MDVSVAVENKTKIVFYVDVVRDYYNVYFEIKIDRVIRDSKEQKIIIYLDKIDFNKNLKETILEERIKDLVKQEILEGRIVKENI